VRDVTLIGQNVNAYHGLDRGGRSRSLADLLARVSDVDGILRMRYTTSHPRDMSDDLIEAHRDLPKLAPYLHLPVQSGSDWILAAMNRAHGRAEYLATIERVRRARADIAFTSDFIVGFPGETEADFQATLDLVEEAGFAMAYSFKYSARPGTPAADMDPVPEDEKTERLQRLQALIDRQWRKFNSDAVGQSMSVLFEKRGKLPGQLVGKSPYQHQVQADAPDSMIGETAKVRIVRAGTNSLFGELDTPARPRAAAAFLHEASGGA
jgi:tRNA-2-methylthio-N6-dimethylallyladenosine synthase